MRLQALIPRLDRLYPTSLVSEFCRIFGPANTEKLLTIFAGVTLRIPSTGDLIKAERNLAIYEILCRAKDKADFRILRKQCEARFGLSKGKVKSIFRGMRRVLKDAKEVSDVDKASGELKRRKLRYERPERRKI